LKDLFWKYGIISDRTINLQRINITFFYYTRKNKSPVFETGKIKKQVKKSDILNITYKFSILFTFFFMSCSKRTEGINQIPEEATRNYTEILGRPTNYSVTMSILFNEQTDVYWEYGTSSGSLNMSTATFSATKDTPLEVDFTGLAPNTRYYYRTRHRAGNSNTLFLAGQVHTFHTLRPAGSTFSFAVEADPHLDYNSDTSAFVLTLRNILSKDPDFMIDLGDTFMSEKLTVIDQTEISNRHLLLRKYFDILCHSIPLYLAIGNHEGELGWLYNGTSNNLPVMAANVRKSYYPNPLPNSYYSGNSKSENLVGLRENYYSWEWGDVLFIVLDPYWYTKAKPDWGWTLGRDQYDWFKNIITTSHAKFKFIFCHQLVGGNGNDGRGGTEFASFFEMGGNNLNGTPGFDTYRPGWGKPIHTLMVENHANIFFHGHDHFFGKQDKDGIVYQEVPQPSNKSLTNISASQYGYVNGVLMPGRGYLLVTITSSSAKIDYIKTYLPDEESTGNKNEDIGYTYTIN
jgi:hypothetical protein